MVGSEFSVHPRRSKIPSLLEVVKTYGVVAPARMLSGWSECREVFFHNLEAVPLNPFCSPLVDPSFLVADNRQDNADAVEDYIFGHDCDMTEGEWECFCRDVLLLGQPIARTFDAVIEMVDDMLETIVHAVCGGERFTYATGPQGPKLMDFVVVLARFLILCGGSGVMPRDYALARFGDVCPLVAGGPFVGREGRAAAHKVVRRLTSLGRCVRGLLRAAWDGAVWSDPVLAKVLGLGAGGSYVLADVWRAAMGMDSSFARIMQNIIGPSYEGESEWKDGHVIHEYFSSSWQPPFKLSPMSSDTIAGAVVLLIVHGSGVYSKYGGVDRQYQMFLHDLHWGFMHDAKYAFMCGDSAPSCDLLAVFGVTVGKVGGVGSAREFCVDGVGSWMVGGESDDLGQFGDVAGGDVMRWFLAPVYRSKLFHYRHSLARAARYDAQHRAASVMASALGDRQLISGSVFSGDDVLALVASLSTDDGIYTRMEEVGKEEEEEELGRLRAVCSGSTSW